MNTTNPLAVAAQVAAVKAHLSKGDLDVLSGALDQIFGLDLNTPYPGNILSIPGQAAKAVSFNFCDVNTYKKFARASSTADFFEFKMADGNHVVHICIYSVREETAARVAMHIDGINTPFFVRMIPNVERLERFKKHPKICMDSEEVLTDAAGVKVPFCTYHSEDSDVKRFVVVPPEIFEIRFNPEWVSQAAEATTSHF